MPCGYVIYHRQLTLSVYLHIFCVRLLQVCSFNGNGQCEGLNEWDGQQVWLSRFFISNRPYWRADGANDFKMRDSKKSIFVLVMSVLLFIAGQSCGKRSGDEITINRECFGATTKSTFESMVHNCVTGDKIGLLNMMYSGSVRQIPAGTKGTFLEDGGTCYRVRLNDDYGTWWISCDHAD